MFSNSSTAPVPSKPLLVYQRRSSATSYQPPDPLEPPHVPSSTAAHVPATATPSHRQSTRVRKPPNRYGYSLLPHPSQPPCLLLFFLHLINRQWSMSVGEKPLKLNFSHLKKTKPGMLFHAPHL